MPNEQATLPNDDIETQAPTMAETMAATLGAINARSEAQDVKDDTSQKADRVRAPDGKFAKSDQSQEAKADQGKSPAVAPEQGTAALTQPVTAPTQAATEQAPVEPQAPATPAPSSWKAEAKAEWAKLPPVIQSEVMRREQQIHDGIKQYKAAADYGQSIHNVLTPYQPLLNQLGVTADVAVRELMQTDHALRNGAMEQRLGALAAIAQNYGLDTSQGLPNMPQIDPNYQRAQQELNHAKQELARLQAEQKNNHEAAIASQIESVRQKFPQIDELNFEVAALLQAAADRNQDLTLEDACTQAMWASPKHRAELLAKQSQELAEKNEASRLEAARKTQEATAAAKAASAINVAKRGTHAATSPTGSMQDTMTATLGAIRSR